MFFRKHARRPLLHRRRERKNNKKKLFIVFLLILAIGGIMFGLFKSPFFKISSLEYKFNNINCVSEDEIKKSVFGVGQNIFFIDTSLIEKSLTSKFECIRKVSVKKVYPQKLNIELSGRSPVASVRVFRENEASGSASLVNVLQEIASPSAIATDSARLVTFEAERAKLTPNTDYESFWVDDEGNVFVQSSGEEGLPVISVGDFKLSVGSNFGKDLINNLLTIFDKLRALNVGFEEVRLYKQSNLLVKSEKIILLDLTNDLQKQLASLQLILEKAKIENENISVIDLRFDKPVVRYVQKKGR